MDYKSNWDFYFCNVNEHFASISLDLGIAHLPENQREKLPYRLWVSVLLQNPDGRGMPTSDEANVLADFEDTVTEVLGEKLGAIQVGRIKNDGKLELFYYSPTEENFAGLIDEIIGTKFRQYKYAIDSQKDNAWDDYFNLLYPSAYEFQCIQNRKVIQQLSEHNDNPDAEREVDHWIYFNNPTDADKFISEAEKLGYKLLSNKQNDKGTYAVNISRTDITDWDAVNEYVWELYQLAEDNNGDYDGWGCTIVKNE